MNKTVAELATRWLARNAGSLSEVEKPRPAERHRPQAGVASTPTRSMRRARTSATGSPTPSPASAARGPSSCPSSLSWSSGRCATPGCSGARRFDPYPFIFLNLVLSMIAALQAPVIMMSQNRQAERDRLDAGHDYEVNLKAEIEIMALHEKLDELRHSEIIEVRDDVKALAARSTRIEQRLDRAAALPDDRYAASADRAIRADRRLPRLRRRRRKCRDPRRLLRASEGFRAVAGLRGRLRRLLHRRHAAVPGRAPFASHPLVAAHAPQARLQPRLPAGAALSEHSCSPTATSTACAWSAASSPAFRASASPRFLLINGLSALLWAAIFSGIGYAFGLGAERVLGEALHEHQRLLIALGGGVIFGIAAYLASHYGARHQRRVTARLHPDAALEDQRDDQILLVGEMPPQHGDQPGVLVGIGIGGEALPVGIFLQRPQEGVGRVGVALQRFVDDVMIAVEDARSRAPAGFRPWRRAGNSARPRSRGGLRAGRARSAAAARRSGRTHPASSCLRDVRRWRLRAGRRSRGTCRAARATSRPGRGCCRAPASPRADIWRRGSADPPAARRGFRDRRQEPGP